MTSNSAFKKTFAYIHQLRKSKEKWDDNLLYFRRYYSKTSKAQSKWHRWPRWPRYKTSTLIVSLVSRSFKHSMPMRTNCGRAAPRNDIGSGIIDRRLVLSFPLSMKYLQRYHKMAKWRNGHRQQNLITELETARCAAFNVSTESFCQGEVARYCKPNLPILRKQK